MPSIPPLAEADKRALIDCFTQRLTEYQQDLNQEGLTAQQYNILRGQIKELNALSQLFNP